jgi:hypothetical protein
MKKAIVVTTLALLPVLSFADPIGYPGSTWNVITTPASSTGIEEDNTIIQGKIEQGIDWFYLDSASTWKFNTYASFGYSADSEHLDYNNKAVPAIGAKVTKTLKNGAIDIGVQAFKENRWEDGVSDNGVQLYVSSWFGWNLKGE